MKFRYRLTILAVLILFISAMTACPVMGNECGYQTQSQFVSEDLVFDTFVSSWDAQNDTLYAFITLSEEQGIIHLKNDENGLPTLQGIYIGDKSARIHKNTTKEQIIIDAFDEDTHYQIWFSKPTQELTIFQITDTGIKCLSDSLPFPLLSGTDLSDVNEFKSRITQATQTVAVPSASSSISCFDIVLALLLFKSNSYSSSPVSIPLLIGYFMNGAAANPLCIIVEGIELAVGTTVEADVLYLTTIGSTAYYVSKTTLNEEFETAKKNGFKKLDKFHFAVKVQDKWQKYLYNPMDKTAIYIGELGFIEKTYLDITDAVVQFHGDLQKAGKDFITYLGKSVGIISKEESNDCVTCKQGQVTVNERAEKDTAAVTAKWYAVYDIENADGSKYEISETSALEKLKKCKNDKDKNGKDIMVFIQGESREECKKLAEKASDGRIPEDHRLNDYNVKKHQYPHYHPVDANGKKCDPHCFWIP